MDDFDDWWPLVILIVPFVMVVGLIVSVVLMELTVKIS